MPPRPPRSRGSSAIRRRKEGNGIAAKNSSDPDKRCWKRTDQEEPAAGVNEAPNFRTRVLCATEDMFTKDRRPTVTKNVKVTAYS